MKTKPNVNYVVLMQWEEPNRTRMCWGRGETMEDIKDGMYFYQDKPGFKYEIYEVSKKVRQG